MTYDKALDAAYIFFGEMDGSLIAKTYPCDPREVNGMINLDFSEQGALVGIEILDASKKLPAAVLEWAEQI